METHLYDPEKTNNVVSDHVRDWKVKEWYIRVVKTKVKICIFVFAYAKCWFSHDAAHNVCVCVCVYFFHGNSTKHDCTGINDTHKLNFYKASASDKKSRVLPFPFTCNVWLSSQRYAFHKI